MFVFSWVGLHKLRPSIFIITLVAFLPLERAWPHGAYHDQIAAIDVQLKERPEDAELRISRAATHLAHQDWNAALIDLELADRLSEGRAATQGLRGEALNQAKQWRQAQACLEDHLRLLPNDTKARYELGRALAGLSLRQEAITEMRRSFSQQTSDQDIEKLMEFIQLVDVHCGSKAAHDELLQHEARIADPSLLAPFALDLAKRAEKWDAALLHVGTLAATAPRVEPWMAEKARILELSRRHVESLKAWRALQSRLFSLPNLERGTPLLAGLLAESSKALGQPTSATVVAPPSQNQHPQHP